MSAYLDYYSKIDFDQTVYVYHDEVPNLVVKYTLAELASEYAEETTTPRGVGPKYFAEDNCLYYWSGSKQMLVSEFDTAEEADNAFLISALHDLDESEVEYFHTVDELYESVSDWQDPDDFEADELINKEKLRVVTDSEAFQILRDIQEKKANEEAGNLYQKVIEKFDYTPDFESKEGVKLYRKLAFCVKIGREVHDLDFALPAKELNIQVAKLLGNSAANTGFLRLPAFAKKNLN